MRYTFQRRDSADLWFAVDNSNDLNFINALFKLYHTNWPAWELEIVDNTLRKVIYATFTKGGLFNYNGSYEDFPEGSGRYYAQLAVDHHGAAVRDNSIDELITIGKGLDIKIQNGED